jgi:two-component system, NtrC family, nitrogen regulation response regulator NtrX
MKAIIIDDEQNICLTLCSILEDEGYDCLKTQNSSQALDLVQQEMPDVVLLDVCMPDINGLEVLEKIKQIDKDIQVIMISGHSGISEAVKAIKLGAFDFLEKPLGLPKVKLTVKKAQQFRDLCSDYERMKKDYSQQYQLIGNSPEMEDVRKVISKVAPSNSKVLIRGESGTGKELIAYAIHNQSDRSKYPFVKFNSAAIPTELVESELFGYEKGAFTGAVKSKKGKLEEADKGSLFLDEVGDMSLSAQAKILRVIQEGEFERVGSNRKEKIDTRIIAATHKNLEEMVKSGTFREDLYYRLNVIPIISPPLRVRTKDMEILINYFSKMFQADMKVAAKSFLPDTIDELKKHTFPGNVRELKNLIERIYILIDHNTIKPEDLYDYQLFDSSAPCLKSDSRYGGFWDNTALFSDKKREFERKYLITQLRKFDSNITKTSQALGLHQSNLSRKIKELNISTEDLVD